MYQNFADGMTLTEISDALAERGIYNRKGRSFGKTSILRILDQEKYRGFSILQRTFTESHIAQNKQINRGELPKYLVQGTHPRIIPDELHNRVAAERERRRHIGVIDWRSGTCFTGKIICGYCGHTYTYDSCIPKNKHTQFQQGQYRCSNKRRHGITACDAKNLPVYTLHQVCCTVLNPQDADSQFSQALVEEQVEQIVVCTDSLEFHLRTGSIISTFWKNTAKRDLQAYRRAMKQQTTEVES